MDSILPKAKLKFWLDNNFSVLLIGKHGIGKTAKVKAIVKKKGLKALYFSCATLDPWVDFIGIPMKVKKDGVTYLELIRPKAFAFDDVEFIFLDELNRAPPKVQNAVLELIQFGSINGKKFKNLKTIWAAINPPPKKNTDTSYHVEELDPAMITRFQVRFNLPFKIDEEYFTKKHGSDMYSRISNWWGSLPEGLQDEFPPRSVDYALEMMEKGGDVGDCLPEGIPKMHFLNAVKASGVKKVRGTTGSGVTISDVFNTVDPTSIKTIIKANKKDLNRITSDLSNEEFLKLFRMVGVSPQRRLTTLGGALVKAANLQQVRAIRTGVNATNLDMTGKRILRDNCNERVEDLRVQRQAGIPIASDRGSDEPTSSFRPFPA